MGKGSGRRPRDITPDEEAANWQRTFGTTSSTPDASAPSTDRPSPPKERA